MRTLKDIRRQVESALRELDENHLYTAQASLATANQDLVDYLFDVGYRKNLSPTSQKMLGDLAELAALVGMKFVADPEKVAEFEAAQKEKMGIDPFLPGRYLDGLREQDRRKSK